MISQNKLLLLVLLLVGAALFQPVSAVGPGRLVPDDILLMEEPGHFTLSPDGVNLVYIKTLGTDLIPPKGNGTLMYRNVQANTEIAISNSSESVISYALSPDGFHVAYAAMPRSGGLTTLYLTNLNDLSTTRLNNGTDELAAGFSYLGTDRLIFPGTPTDYLPPSGPGDVIVVDETPAPVILKTYSLHDGIITPISGNKDVITLWEPSPDGRYVMFKASPDSVTWQTGATFRYILLDTRTGQEKELFSLVEGYQDVNQFAWSPDSSVVYIERMQNGGLRYPVEYTSDLLACSPATGTIEEVPLNWSRGLLIDLFNNDIEVNPFNGGVYLLLADGPNPKLARVTKNSTGWQVTLLNGKHQGNIFAVEADRTGTNLVYNYNSAESPPQFFSANVEGAAIVGPVQLTDMNHDLVKKPLGSSEVTEWKGAKGDTVQGVIRYPPGYVPGKEYPLVLVIHGGPNYADFNSWRDTWEFPYHLITDTGAVTLSVNYHGGTNYGFDFAQSIEGGHYYDLPIMDLETGADHLARRGIINRSRVGVTGWSNGGMLTLALITKDPTLKAAIAGAGTVDENSQVANTNGIVMDEMYYNKSPFQDPAAFQQVLPIYHAKDARTPLLMMIGTNDNSVAPASAWVTYRAFKEGSTAPVRFILFRDQPHHMKTYGAQLRKVQEELDWLDRYLFHP
ncbi:MAG: prolyl oligopeptidase family serine peptidase [Methanomicrobiales archaeon]|nr:prolyl oligopeptidase family serine peptidase [Methanomicrobiales archaeon]